MNLVKESYPSQVVSASGEGGILEGRCDLVCRGPVLRQRALYQQGFGQLVLRTACMKEL